MRTNNPQPEDYEHYDGVFIGRSVPKSVFYAGRRPSRCKSFKKPTVDTKQQKRKPR